MNTHPAHGCCEHVFDSPSDTGTNRTGGTDGHIHRPFFMLVDHLQVDRFVQGLQFVRLRSPQIATGLREHVESGVHLGWLQ